MVASFAASNAVSGIEPKPFFLPLPDFAFAVFSAISATSPLPHAKKLHFARTTSIIDDGYRFVWTRCSHADMPFSIWEEPKQ
ncbi:MAG: hypothetical protein IPM41_04825 [Sphingomonadales bacterium]|nr:hypothetical protein [Sphingomonadales bacterium]